MEREVTSSRRRRLPNIDDHARHAVRFFGGAFPAGDVASFLNSGSCALAVVSKGHSELLVAAFRTRGVKVEEATASGELTIVSAEDVCDAMIADGRPTEERFLATIGKLVDDLVARRGPISIYGEVVDLLAQRGRTDDAITLEKIWIELLARRPARLLCGYGFASVATEATSATSLICDLHDSVDTDES